jgi:hypothetical protein
MQFHGIGHLNRNQFLIDNLDRHQVTWVVVGLCRDGTWPARKTMNDLAPTFESFGLEGLGHFQKWLRRYGKPMMRLRFLRWRSDAKQVCDVVGRLAVDDEEKDIRA